MFPGDIDKTWTWRSHTGFPLENGISVSCQLAMTDCYLLPVAWWPYSYSMTLSTLPIAIVLPIIMRDMSKLDLYVSDKRMFVIPSSLRVNRPIWGKSLNGSIQITPAASRRIIAIWSCLTNRGRTFDFSLVFLSTRQMSAFTETSSATVWMWQTAE